MADPMHHYEAEIIQARERLARALARLSALTGGVPEKLQLIEEARTDAQSRLAEATSLLERERAITSQRDSLGESAKAELEAARQEIQECNALVSERDAMIENMRTELDALRAELEFSVSKATTSLQTIETLEETIAGLRDENEHIVRQLELLREERDKAMRDLREARSEENNVALTFTNDERLNLLKTIDTIIERVDSLSHHNGRR